MRSAIVLVALLAVSQFSDLRGPDGATGPQGAAGGPGSDGVGYTGLGITCPSGGLELRAAGGLFFDCGGNSTQSLLLTGSSDGQVATQTRVAPQTTGIATLVVTAASGVEAVHVESSAAQPALVVNGNLDLSHPLTAVGLPMRWISNSAVQSVTAACASNEIALGGGCYASSDTSFETSCLATGVGNCATAPGPAFGMLCTANSGVSVAAYALCLQVSP